MEALSVRGAGLAVTLGLASLQIALPSAYAANTLSFVDSGTEPVPVRLSTLPTGERGGTLNLVIRNDSASDGGLRIRFFPTRTGEAIDLSASKQPRRATVRWRVPRDVTFAPASITLGITRDPWPFSGNHHERALVTLRGDGAGAVADAVGDATAAYAVLANDDGRAVQVRLEDLRRVDGVVQAEVEASAIESIGKYSGELALSPAGADAPKLSVTTKVHGAFGWAVLAAFLGAVVGALIPLQQSIGRRRRLLQVELEGALATYEREREQSGNEPAGYDLEARPLIGPKPWDEGPCGARGVRALVCDVEKARTDGEFEEDARKVRAVLEEIDLWLAVERPVRQVRELLADMPRDRGEHAFIDSKIYRQTYELLGLASDPPKSAEAGRELLDKLRTQTVVLVMFRDAWRLHDEVSRKAERLSAQQNQQLGRIDIDAISKESPSPQTRKPEELQELRYKLHRATLMLEQFKTALPEVHEDLAVTNIAERLESAEKEVSERVDFEPERKDSPVVRWKRGLAYLNTYDVVWTLLSVAVASAVYATTIYNDDDWGSLVDYAVAFGAGFGAKLGTDSALKINWGELPLFRSRRLGGRKPESGWSADAPPTSTSGEPPPVPAAAAARRVD